MKPRAILRRSPEDFVVEEMPLFEPTGEGAHLLLTIQKCNLTTLEAVSRICRALDSHPANAGYAGMKDRRAVATQRVSLAWPGGRAPEDACKLELPGVCVLSAARHRHKLKPGHLRGNRFAIILRDLAPSVVAEVSDQLRTLGRLGVPNAFGPQRFGQAGDNPNRALAWLCGREAGPRDRRQRRLLFSALQSHLFNQVLERRVTEGTWNRPLQGDILKKRDTGGLFLCVDPVLEAARVDSGEVSPTGPLFGTKMRWPEGEAAQIENEVLAETTGAAGINPFEGHANLGEGSRRALRLLAEELRVDSLSGDQTALRVEFVLPKGGYATTLLGSVLALEEESAPT